MRENRIEELLIVMTMLLKTFSEKLSIENEMGKFRLNDWIKDAKKNEGFYIDEERYWPDDFEEDWE